MTWPYTHFLEHPNDVKSYLMIVSATRLLWNSSRYRADRYRDLSNSSYSLCKYISIWVAENHKRMKAIVLVRMHSVTEKPFCKNIKSPNTIKKEYPWLSLSRKNIVPVQLICYIYASMNIMPYNLTEWG